MKKEEEENKDKEEDVGLVTVSIYADTRDMLRELKTAYMLKSLDQAIWFLHDNMKKVSRPKTRFD